MADKIGVIEIKMGSYRNLQLPIYELFRF